MTGGYLGDIRLNSITSNMTIQIDISLDYNTEQDAICIKVKPLKNKLTLIEPVSILDTIKNMDFKSDYTFPLDNQYLNKLDQILSNLNLHNLMN